MTDMEVLQAYRHTTLEIKAIHQQMEQYGIGRPAALTTQRYDRTGGATNDREAAQRQRMEGLEEQLEERLTYLQGILTRFEQIVRSAGSPFLCVLLRRYYALGESERAVAFALGCSEKTVHRARQMCIESLANKIDSQ